MTKNLIFVFCITVTMLFGNCAMAAQSTADVPVTKDLRASARQKILSHPKTDVKGAEEYVIGYGDVLGVQVYGEGDMSVEAPSGTRTAAGVDSPRAGVGGVTVRNDGKISLKHVGDVDAVGFTLTQLADYLKIIFGSVYDDPVVTVVLGQSNSQRYTVMGKVVQPGIYYLDYPINLVQVIARCGGFNEWANSEMTVVRKNPGENSLFKENTLKFDYDDFLAGKNLEYNVFIKSDDIVIVH